MVYRAVRVMLSTHPYTNWPLHVKLFTEDAVKHWNASDETNSRSAKGKGKQTDLSAGLPQGSIVSVELEGVDGKGESILLDQCTRRLVPIEVTDGMSLIPVTS